MFSYKLLVGFTIIAIGLTNPITNILLNQPERCCLPKQYSSKFNLMIESTLPDGTIHTSNTEYDDAHDEIHGFSAIRLITDGGSYSQKQTQVTLYDLNNGTMYSIISEINFCQKHCRQSGLKLCIPETATYINSSNYEVNGKQILGDTWSIDNGLLRYQTYSRGNCIPLKTEYTDNQYVPTVFRSVTTDFVEYIRDPTIFDIPTQCH